MASQPSSVWLDGKVVDFADAKVPVTDRGLQFAESIYEVIPVTRGKPRMLNEHIERMRTGAAALGIEDGVPEAQQWEHMFATLLARDGVEEGVLYAQVTGGTAPRIHVPSPRPEPRFFCYLSPLRFPRPDLTRRGATVITQPDVRWGRCDLKTTMLLPAVLAKRAAAARNCSEALLLGPNQLVREGASSNVFLVEGKTIVTPNQTTHVLPGITRTLVAGLAREAGLVVQDRSVAVDQLIEADEVFLCSTTLLVMPVLFVDDHAIAGGSPGPIALDLATRLRRHFKLDD